MTDKVLIIDGNSPSGLSAVRSLKKHGLKVGVLSTRAYSYASHSKYVYENFGYANPLESLNTFQRKILKIIDKGYSLLFYFSDDSALALFSMQDKLPDEIKKSFPPKGAIKIAFDKLKTVRLCKKLNIPAPKTYTKIKDISINSFPLVAKSRGLFNQDFKFSKKNKITFINSMEEFKKNIKPKNLLIFQEYIPGKEYGSFFLVNHGKIRASFAHQRILSFKPYGGASIFRKSIKFPKEMWKYSTKILKKLKWHGIAMIEFKKDERDSKYKLIEINGRFWGSLPLAISAGIDFPYLYYKMCKEGDVKVKTDYRINIYQKNIIGMISSIPSYIFDKVPNIENRCILDLAYGLIKLSRDDVFSLKDPMPFVNGIKYLIRRILN
ncbi:MAG: ATP-grasp domain-containing protein [Candidatus Aenigmatarchaeota archaeon]